MYYWTSSCLCLAGWEIWQKEDDCVLGLVKCVLVNWNLFRNKKKWSWAGIIIDLFLNIVACIEVGRDIDLGWDVLTAEWAQVFIWKLWFHFGLYESILGSKMILNVNDLAADTLLGFSLLEADKDSFFGILLLHLNEVDA